MNPLLVMSFSATLLALVLVLLPFFKGEGGRLEDAASEDSVEKLKLRQEALMGRWVSEYRSFKDELITPREWRQRKIYLTNRYVDTARRIDWLMRRGDA